MTHEIAVVPGDGAGREVIPAAVEVLDALDVDLRFTEARAGDAVAEETGDPLPEATSEVVATADATLFGAAGETAADVVLPLREAVGSYANVRPVRGYPEIDGSNGNVDLVVVRENTEGVYAGVESEVADGVTTLTRVVTEAASRKIAEFGFRYAEREGYDRVTVAHKANVMTTTDGLFLETAEAVGEDFDVACDAELLDALAMYLVARPEEYGVVVCPNLAGDVLSDLGAGLVGGLGLVPSANIGPDNAMFEPVHGTAPDIAGEGVANPVAAIYSAALLLDHLDESDAAARVREAVTSVLTEGPRTPDVGGAATTDAVGAAIVERL